MSSFFLADWHCSTQDPALSKIITIFSLLGAYTVLSGPMKGSQEEEGFLVGLRLIFLCSEVMYVMCSATGPYHAVMMGYEEQ